MNIKRNRLAVLFLTILAVCATGVLPVYGNAGATSISEGTSLPNFKIDMTLSPEMIQYLGVETGPDFTLKQIRSKLIVIEVLSAFCQECHKNAPQVNKLYNIISNDSVLHSDVKMLGIAVGDDTRLVEVYKNTYKVKFPIVADPKDNIKNLLGNVATPSIIVADKKGTVLFIHEGVIDDMDLILDVIRTFHSQ
ncbi:MAG: TlpA family protein disulfide reductase [Desulfobacteraceae bacterium]|nr:TlpA family protein disulfide reductase [Desulfobacteraceae bacterium]MBC2757865.1 TlpA family protein disulfide reductase [Desulfobacteraceae bacterium]